MTLASQKRMERFYAEEASRMLNRPWSIGQDRERPDFVVTDGPEMFGLEVCEVFLGLQGDDGSERKREESLNQKIVDALRREYERVDSTPLIVQLVGEMSPENLKAVVPALLALDLANRSPTYHQEIRIDQGEALLIVYVTVGLRSNWINVNDRVGFVHRSPIREITSVVERKATKLSGYRATTGLDDIRLLVVANRIMNSGKLALSDTAEIDPFGFSMVYFFSYPESLLVFPSRAREHL